MNRQSRRLARFARIEASLSLWHDASDWMRGWFERLRQKASRWRDRQRYALRAPGALFLGMILLVGLAAMLSGNNLLFLVWAVLLAMMLVSGLVGRLSLEGLSIEFEPPEHAAAGQRVVGRLRLRNRKRLAPSCSIHVSGLDGGFASASVYFPFIAPRETAECALELRFPRRGLYRSHKLRIASAFPFGFLDRRAEADLHQEVVIYPRLDAREGFEDLLAAIAGQVESRRQGQDGDFYRLRAYSGYESVRHIDWKSTAHTGEPMVREFAREEDTPIDIFLDLAVDGANLEWFERAVECCAYLVWHLSRRLGAARLRTQDFSLTVPREGDVYTMLKYLALVAPSPSGRSRPASPSAHEKSIYHLVFTANPQAYLPHRAEGAHVLGPHDPPFGGPVPAGGGAHRAGPHLRHHR